MERERPEDDDEPYLYPATVATLGVPNERFLKMAHKAYTPSKSLLQLPSEENRRIFAEAFIGDIKLGPLTDLSVRALAKAYPPEAMLPTILEDPLKKRIYFDSLSLDTPLEECYQIEDDLYWRRVVLAKTKDISLAYKSSYDWKSLGISLKLVEMLESYKAEYFPDQYVKELSYKIKKYVKEMHIRHLQTLEDHTFDQYFNSTETESPTDTETDSVTISSSEGSVRSQRSFSVRFGLTEEEIRQERQELAAENAKRNEKQLLKAAQVKRRASRAERRLRKNPPPPPPPPKGRQKFRPRGVFDIPLEPDEEEKPTGLDRRDQSKMLSEKKKREYKTEISHHIDLRFVQYFDNLREFVIEFLGPKLGREYHTKHFNFSYEDMMNLANGLEFLTELRVFRLRNSRMDARKLHTLVLALRDLENLEVIDFGYDQLQDDCGEELALLFENATSIRELELEGNSLGLLTMENLGAGLRMYKGHLEYLGLGECIIEEESMHELMIRIVGSSQITHLCLKGAMLNMLALRCCIAGKLLARHKALKRLDLSAVNIHPMAALDLVQALRRNFNIQEINCRGCGLAKNIEIDLSLVCQRNKYRRQNPYIGDSHNNEEDILKFAAREKNPILLAVREAIRKREECLEARRYDEVKLRTPVPSYVDTHDSYESKYSYLTQPIENDPNNFNEEEFLENVSVPGHGERYYLFRQVRMVQKKCS